MKKVTLIIASIALVKAVKSQDLIVRNDSSKLQAVISEIYSDYIKYKRLNLENGPTYVANKSDISYVVFKNGLVEHFTKQTKIKPQVPTDFPNYNLDGSYPRTVQVSQNYNMDGSPPQVLKINSEHVNTDHLYKRKNYIGLNHLALLNSNVSFTYMRDIAKEKIILQVPVSFGIGKPDITNSTYNGNYLNYGSKNTYNLMNYQVGMGLLFTPSFGEKVNFLIGPSFSFSQHDMSTKTTYMMASPTQTNTFISGEFKNNFVLFRQFYGATLGFMFRMSEKINMTLTANVGCKKDSYNEKDPFGIDYVNSQTNLGRDRNTNVLPYANFSWTIGYRF